MALHAAEFTKGFFYSKQLEILNKWFSTTFHTIYSIYLVIRKAEGTKHKTLFLQSLDFEHKAKSKKNNKKNRGLIFVTHSVSERIQGLGNYSAYCKHTTKERVLGLYLHGSKQTHHRRVFSDDSKDILR